MIGVGGASAAYSRSTGTTKQSHKSQLNTHFLFFLKYNSLLIPWLISTHPNPINESPYTDFAIKTV